MRPLVPAVVVAAAAALSSCSAFTTGEPPACPDVVILADAARLTKFTGGPGRTLADIEVEAEIVGYKGECRRVKNGVEVTLAVSMDARRPKAGGDAAAEVAYFVAMPDYYPSPQAKAVFATRIAFPANVAAVRHVDDPVAVTVPLAPGETASGKEIYLGFQLSDEQLRYNRGR